MGDGYNDSFGAAEAGKSPNLEFAAALIIIVVLVAAGVDHFYWAGRHVQTATKTTTTTIAPIGSGSNTTTIMATTTSTGPTTTILFNPPNSTVLGNYSALTKLMDIPTNRKNGFGVNYSFGLGTAFPINGTVTELTSNGTVAYQGYLQNVTVYSAGHYVGPSGGVISQYFLTAYQGGNEHICNATISTGDMDLPHVSPDTYDCRVLSPATYPNLSTTLLNLPDTVPSWQNNITIFGLGKTQFAGQNCTLYEGSIKNMAIVSYGGSISVYLTACVSDEYNVPLTVYENLSSKGMRITRNFFETSILPNVSRNAILQAINSSKK